jgi:parallel beta-helix repeat protein
LKRIFQLAVLTMLLGTTVTPFLGACARVSLSRTVETVISAAPTQITVTLGQNFTINITVSDVEYLYAWQVLLKYNATVMSCTAAWIPEDNVFAKLQSFSTAPVLNDATVDGYNYTAYADTLMTAGSVNASQATLCTLNFTCQSYGSTSLQIATEENPVNVGDFYFPTPMYSELLDPNLNKMFFTAQDIDLQPTLTILSAPNGTTTPPNGNYSYTYGTNVSVAANPDTSYVLSNWLVDSNDVGSANPITIQMASNHTLQPIFIQAEYALTIVGATGGNASLLPGTYTYKAGQAVQISATADTGYVFGYWMLDGFNAGSDNPFPVTMNSNHTLAPIFSQTSYAYVYIRADGSIDPTGVPISTLDNVTYHLTGDLGSTITVQRSNIQIIGDGHTLQGTGSGEGIRLIGVDNVSVTNINIIGFDNGIDLSGTSQNIISENNLTANNGLSINLYNSVNNTICRNNIVANKVDGIHLDYLSNYNNIFENNIKDNNRGIYVDSSSDNLMYHNNIVNNTNQVFVAAHGSPHNSWDDGVEGNYWSTYTGFDSNLDGIGDALYFIDANNTDRFPLMGLFSGFSVPQGYSVNIVSNSTVTNFAYSSSERRISFNVEGEHDTSGFCQLTIPHVLLDSERIEVAIDNGSTPILYSNLDLRDNTTCRWIIFCYRHSTHTIVVQEDWTPPVIVVLSPENKTYAMDHVSLNFTTSEQVSWEGYSLDSSVNVTIAGNTTLSNLFDGSHVLTVYANDTVGNMGRSDTILFEVNTTPPTIIVLSPENKTYSVDHVSLNFTVSEETSWEGYSLDGSANVTIAGNQTLDNISDGIHSIIVYGNDTAGNMGISNAVSFTVDTTPPNITQVLQDPSEKNVLPGETVTVNATVVDNISGMRRMNMNYTYTNGSLTFTDILSMTNIQGNIWTAKIPAFPYGTNVTYVVVAEDNAGNTITTQEMGFNHQYTIMPEYSTFFILPLLIICSLPMMVLANHVRRKREIRNRRT